MARMSMTASDGTVFGVFESANGNYIAVESEDGSHWSSGGGDGWWTTAQARRYLREAVEEYEDDLEAQAQIRHDDERLMEWLKANGRDDS